MAKKTQNNETTPIIIKLYTFDKQFLSEVDIEEFPICFSGIASHETYDEYLLNGAWHRDNDLPAVIYHNKESKWWYQFGQEHRFAGPAVERLNGNNEYWIHGEQVSKEEHTLLVDIMKLKGLL